MATSDRSEVHNVGGRGEYLPWIDMRYKENGPLLPRIDLRYPGFSCLPRNAPGNLGKFRSEGDGYLEIGYLGLMSGN